MRKSSSSFDMFSSKFIDAFNKRNIFESKIKILTKDESNE